jgi:ABC-2 type transport system ATP-binding protein
MSCVLGPGPISMQSAGQTMNTTAALKVRGLRKSYGDVVAVDGLDLDVGAQECFGLLGPNGAGKTTTIEICEGLVDRDSGDVEMLGRTWERDPKALRQRIGISLQETQLSDKLTVRETLALFRSFYEHPHDVGHVLGQVQLEEKADARISTLSGGQKQRLAVACALIGDPDLLFLDEPTTGLDPQSRRQMWDLIDKFRASGHSIVLTTHYMDEAERLCDRIAIVDHGKVIARGTPAELIASLGAEQMIEFASAGTSPIALADLKNLEGIIDARLDAGTYSLQASKLHRAVPALLAYLAARGAPLTELKTHSATLEDVFVSLTGRHLRDE